MKRWADSNNSVSMKRQTDPDANAVVSRVRQQKVSLRTQGAYKIKNKSVALQALTSLGPAEQQPLAVFPDCTRRYWVDMWSAHRIPQLHFQLSKPENDVYCV
jgi:hypothetical protein